MITIKIVYESMARMSGNDKSYGRHFSDKLQLTKWVLDSGATCHITPQILDFIPGSLGDTDKYVEVADGYYVTVNQQRTSSNNNVQQYWKSFHCNVTQRNFGTGSMRWVIFYWYVNEFGT